MATKQKSWKDDEEIQKLLGAASPGSTKEKAVGRTGEDFTGSRPKSISKEDWNRLDKPTVHTSDRDKTPSKKALLQELGFHTGTVPKDTKWDNELLDHLSKKQYGNSHIAKLTTLFGDEVMAKKFQRYMNYKDANKTIQQKKANEATANWEKSYKENTGSKVTNIDSDPEKLAQFQKEYGKKLKSENKALAESSNIEKTNVKGRKLGLEERQMPSSLPRDKQSDAVLDSLVSSKKDDRNAFEKVMDAINSGLGKAYDNTIGLANRATVGAVDEMALGQGKKKLNKLDETDDIISKLGAPEFVKQAAEAPTTGAEKAADIAGLLGGSAAPIGLAYKPAGWAAKALFAGKDAKYLEAALRGGAAMGLYSGAKEGLDELINPEDATAAQRFGNIGMNIGLGAIADPAILGAMAGGQHLLGRFAPIKGELPVQTGRLSDEALQAVAPQRADSVLKSNELFDRLLGKEPVPNVPKSMDSFVPKETPKVEVPPIADEWFRFAQSGQGPQARGLQPVKNVPKYEKESIQSLADSTINRLDQLSGKPEGYYEQRVLDIQKQMKDNTKLTPEQTRALQDAEEAFTMQKQYEDAYVEQQLAPFRETAQQQANAQAQWENAVKQAKQEAERIKGTYGKIFIPKNALEDYPIPPQFRAAFSDRHANDLFSFADEFGFASPDEAVQYLRQLDDSTKVRLKDLMPEDSYVLKEHEWNALEDAARQSFRKSEGGKAIDKLIADLIEAGSGKQTFDDLYSLARGANDPKTFDELVKLAEMEANKGRGPTLKQALHADPKVNEAVKKLNDLLGVKPRTLPEVPELNMSKAFDESLALLGSERPPASAQSPYAINKRIDEVLNMSSPKRQQQPPKRNEPPKPTPQPQVDDRAMVANVAKRQELEKKLDDLFENRPKGYLKEIKKINKELDRLEADYGKLSGSTPETSSNAKPLGITAGGAVDDGSWIRAQPTLREKIESGKVSLASTIQKSKTELSSASQPIKDMEREIAKMDHGNVLEMIPGKKNDVKFADSLYKSIRAVSRAISEAMNAAKRDYGVIIKDLKQAKISRKDFDEYASAVHFADILKSNGDKVRRTGDIQIRLQEIEALVQGTNDKKILKTLGDEEKKLLKELTDLEPYIIPAKATPEKIQATLDRWKNTPAMLKAQKEFMTAQHNDLDLLVEAGLYSPEAAQAMKDKHPNYVFMGRVKEERMLVGNNNPSKPGKHIKKRGLGSEEDIYSPLESAVRNRLQTYTNARKNQAMQKIEKLAFADKTGKNYFNKLNPHVASESQMRNAVKYFENGEAQYYEVPPALKDAFEQLDAKTAQDLFSKSIKAAANITRKGATYYNVPFMFKSAIRDSQNAVINSRTNLHPGELALGFLDSLFGKGLEKATGGVFKSYRDTYHALGGDKTGFVSLDPKSTEAFVKAMDRKSLGKGIQIIDPRNWVKGIEQFGSRMEHGQKLAEFRSAKNKGYSDMDAMHEAVDVIDYADMGKTIKWWNDKIPFLNATVRGNVRYFQAAKENFPAWMAKNALYVSAPTTGIYLMRYSPTTSDEQRSKLRNMTPWQKNMFWHIPVPNSETILSIPKMYVGAQLFANPIERALDNIMGEDTKTWQRILKDTGADSMNALIPPHAAAGVQQLMSAAANYDPLMDMPIEDASMKKKPKSERYNSYTSEVAKWAGDKLGQSPAKIDYILKGLTGGTGRDALDVMDNTLRSLGLVDRPAHMETTGQILNPLNQFKYKDTSGSGAISRLAYGDNNALKDNDYIRALYREQTGEKTAPKTLVNDLASVNTEVAAAIKSIREDSKLTSKEKQERIAKLRSIQRLIGDEAIRSGLLKDY